MAAFRGPKVWLWRWRRNPLRRRSDVLEAWIMLAAWALTVLGGAVTGLVTIRSVEHGLAQQRAQWHAVPARLAEEVPDTRATESGGRFVWTKVRWSAPDGTPRSGQVRVYAGTSADTPVLVWTDPRGHLVNRPTTVAMARLRAVLVGTFAGAGAAGVPYMAGRRLRDRLERRRMQRWDEEWERIGPLWGRMTS
ncbi:Rv1733c family protein [Streptomyces sp. NBC_00358]|uniref:Rv1733c family protein n=1 Tax=Streptomyces sp. NBC_00358 TaxID=2975725 RepID=UPI002E263300